MPSIQKMLLTPVKWASKQFIHKFLLSFPNGEVSPTLACVYCPEMCRFSCPTAVASGNDAVTPSNKMAQLFARENWSGSVADSGQIGDSRRPELWTIYDCTGCGRCTEYCLHKIPVADRLMEARAHHSWSHAMSVSALLSSDHDPIGDLAWELGDHQSAQKRLEQVYAADDGVLRQWLREPKIVHFLLEQVRDKKFIEKIQWSAVGAHTESWNLKAVPQSMRVRMWNSAWAARRLGHSVAISNWLTRGRELGLNWVFEQDSLYPPTATADVEDVGLEGAYALMFPEQANKMFIDAWRRISSQDYDAVWVWSPRVKVAMERKMEAGEVERMPVLGWWEVVSGGK